MARLHWRITFETLWSPELDQLAHADPKHLKAKDRAVVTKHREAARALLKTLFPEDTDGES